MISPQETRKENPMSELTTKPRKNPFVTAHPSFGIVGLVVLIAVIGMPVQGAAYFGPTAVHPIGAPASAIPIVAASGPGLHISPALLNSPIGIRNHAFLTASVSSAGVAPLLHQLLTQTAPPPHAAVQPAYSGGVNNYVSNSDCQGWGSIVGTTGQFIPTIGGSSIAQVGGSNQTLVAGGGGLLSLFNVTYGVECNKGVVGPAVLANGYSNVFTSSNGGASWTNFSTPANTTHWQNPSDIANGSISTGNNIVAAAPNGLALELTGYAPACLSIPITLTCGSSLGEAAPWGYGVSRSTDSGASWSPTAQISSAIAFSFVTFPAACGVGTSPVLEANDISEHPSLATNGTYAVATWDILHVIWDPANCTESGLQATIQESYSWNGGATWSAPVNVSGPVSEDATVHFGAAPSYPIYEVFSDVSSANASTSGQIQFQWTKSTDGGQTWTPLGANQQIGSHNVNPTCYGCAASPDSIDTEQTAAFAIDNWTGSPHSGNLYIAWQDNETGSQTGEVSIAFERSTDGGGLWSPATYLTTATPSLHYLEPFVTVSPNGDVWVTYYAFGTSSGYYNLYGVLSTDGGATWSPQFEISSASSTPSSTLQDIGYYMGGVGTTAGFVPIWSDCRSSACSSAADVQLYTANLNVLNISTNATVPITAQVTVFGGTTATPLPVNTGVDVGASISVQVPQEVPYNATYVDSFMGWSGLSNSLNFRTTITYNGSGSLVAMYTPVEAAFIMGTLWPNGPGALVTVDNNPVILTAFNSTAYQYTDSVPSGQLYYVNASETKYVTQAATATVEAGQISWENFTLQRQTGFLSGTLTPPSANLTLNSTISETSLVNKVNGQYTITVPWGWYWLNASQGGFTSSTCQGHEVEVTPGAATTCNFDLVGGWIYGSVGPASSTLVVKVDGVVVPNTGGVFNVSVQGGYHNLTTTEKGYNLSFFPTIFVTPGHATAVNSTLTNHGWITGILGPVTALKTTPLLEISNGTSGTPEPYSETTGAFNVTEVGLKNWTITVTASGYNSSTGKVYVTPGNTSTYDVTLGIASTGTGGCKTNCGGTGNNNSNSTPGSSGIPLVDVLAIIVVIVIVAVLAMAMVMRNRGGRGGNDGSSTAPPPDETYQGSNPSDLPKLQSDGSMNEGNP
jgi:predicted Rdx family selenoprotein